MVIRLCVSFSYTLKTEQREKAKKNEQGQALDLLVLAS